MKFASNLGLLLFLMSFESMAICGQSSSIELMAGQNIPAGQITVANTEDELIIQYSIDAPWFIAETHLHLAASPLDFPVTRRGNPKIGQFDYQASYDPPVTEDLYVFDLTDVNFSADGVVHIAAHASVYSLDEVTGELNSETAWALGEGFPGNSWAMYFSYALQSCEEPTGILWRTQTQGGWGSRANGNNVGVLRDTYFNNIFPQHVQIGGGQAFNTRFTSSQSVECFLPESGSPAPLSVSETDPAGATSFCVSPQTSYSVLAGQALALSLNVGFDEYCNQTNSACDFHGMDGDSPVLLGDLLFEDSTNVHCDGKSVSEILALANAVLAGVDSATPPADINACVSAINENFVDGTTDLGKLRVP